MTTPKIICPDCGGSGEVEYEAIIGHVSSDMASDAGCPDMAGEPVFGTITDTCPTCNGYGHCNLPIKEDQE